MDLQDLIKTQQKALEYWYEGINRGDLDHAYSGFAEDCTWSGIGSNLERVLYHGRQVIVDYQNAWVHSVWTGKMTFTPRYSLCDGNVLLAYWTDEAVSRTTGEKYANQGVCLFEYDGLPLVQRGSVWFDAAPLSDGPIQVFAAQNVSTGA